MPIISDGARRNRAYWVEEIRKLSGVFAEDSDRLEGELERELHEQVVGDEPSRILSHLRLCGDIPESYGHDSSEEKLYSKYTDALLSESFKAIGLRSLVIRERGDAADVESFAREFSFVSDAKAFRLSRTAKNQKDFKVQAMHGWKRGKPHAMVVCPIYQLPVKSSQIYEQATSRNVCLFTYSHLALLVRFGQDAGNAKAESLLHQIFKVVEALNPSKDANSYWLAVNRTMLEFDRGIKDLWADEKRAAVESIAIAKDLALTFLAQQREMIMRMDHEQALQELLRVHRIDSRIRTIESVRENDILDIA